LANLEPVPPDPSRKIQLLAGFLAGDFSKHIQPQAVRETASKPMTGNSKNNFKIYG
jgi:hypothetical protein